MNAKLRMSHLAAITILLGFIAHGGSITPQASATSPDAGGFVDEAVWVSYQTGADSAGASVPSRTLRNTPAGTALYSWTTTGNAEGLKVDPSTGLVWAQNTNSALRLIDPVTNGTTPYSYGSTYDDVVLLSGQAYLSENGGPATDPLNRELTFGLTPPAVVASILTAGTITEPDSSKFTRNGEFVLTGEGEQTVVFVENKSSGLLPLQNAKGTASVANADDTVYSADAGGYFFPGDLAPGAVLVLIAAGLGTFIFARYRRQIRQAELNRR